MSHPSDRELDDRLAESRPVLPAGFVDAVMRRSASGGVDPIPLPEPPARRRNKIVPVVAAMLLAAAAVLLFVRDGGQGQRPGEGEARWRVTAGLPVRADGHIAVPEGGHLRLERGGQAIELSGAAVGALLSDEVFHLQHGRARLEGAVTVTTPRARVVGIGADALAELTLEPKETEMILKTASALVAAAAGSVLTVAVIRGDVSIQRTGVTTTRTLSAGERAVIAPDEVAPPVAATDYAALVSRPAGGSDGVAPAVAGGGEAEAAAECPPAIAVGDECGGEAPCGDCDGPPEEAEAAAGGAIERVAVDTDGAPILGAVGARVTIVEFGDYECRFCERAMSTIHELAGLYPNDVRVVFKNFPMPGHKHARLAAEAALAAGEQGKYWEMHDMLLANQERLDRASIDSYAAALGLDAARFRRALDEGRFAKQVERDIEEAKALGLQGVPAFVINGRVVVGARPLAHFKQIVDEELSADTK